MKSNWVFALGLVAVLAAAAGVLWWTRQQLPPNPPAPALPVHGADGKSLPADPSTVALPEGWTVIAAAPAATMTAEEYVLGGPLAEFYLKDKTEVPKLWGWAIETHGGAKALAPLRVATWRVVLSGGLHDAGVLVADADGGALYKPDNATVAIGWRNGSCWLQRGELVLPCHRQAATLIRALLWFHRAQTVQALSEAAWTVETAGVVEVNGQSHNAVHVKGGSGGEMAVVYTDIRQRRVIGVDVGMLTKGTEAPELGHLPSRTKLWLGDLRPFGGAVLASGLRVQVEQADGLAVEDVQVHVSAVEGGGKLPAKAPALVVQSPLSIGVRAGGIGLVFEVGSHDKFGARVGEVLKGFDRFWMMGQFEAVEAFGPVGTPLDSAVQLWLTPLNHLAMQTPGLQPHTKPLPADAAVARKVVKVPLVQVPAALQQFTAEVEKAGHKPAAERRATSRGLAMDNSSALNVVVEFEVPLAPP